MTRNLEKNVYTVSCNDNAGQRSKTIVSATAKRLVMSVIAPGIKIRKQLYDVLAVFVSFIARHLIPHENWTKGRVGKFRRHRGVASFITK